MSCSGRKQDSCWQYFEKSTVPGKSGSRATCKSCNKEMQGLVVRMKVHLAQCIGLGQKQSSVVNPKSTDPTMPPEGIVNKLKRTFSQVDEVNLSVPSASFQSPAKKLKTTSLSSYLYTTTEDEKKALDIQVATMMYATNTPFNWIDHPQVKKVFSMLRPGYSPPSRHEVSTRLLDEIHAGAYALCKEKVEDKHVSMELDGWSNRRNEPVICSSITTYDGDTFLTSTIDTQDERHTGENLEAIAESAIKHAEEVLGCHIDSVVTDNAANMKKCRGLLEESHEVITYPCGAHVCNSLAKEVDNDMVKSDIVDITKYFRNHHVPNALYKKHGGKNLSLPNDTRWNSVNDCLQAYVDNWPVLVNVVEAHREKLDTAICDKVMDMNLKRQAVEYLSKMKPIAVGLDRLQADNCHLADALVIWKDLAERFEDMPLADCKKLDSRMAIALTPAHFLAYLLDPRFLNSTLLTPEEVNMAMDFASEHSPSALPSVINYRAKSKPFGAYMFTLEVLKNTDPLAWWKSQSSMLDKNILSLVEQLFTARASTAGI